MTNTKTPLVSVIIPVYNVAYYLAQCLESVILQTYKNLEIIIIDDASPDSSATVYNLYASRDPRIKIIKHDKNMGLGVARNTGLAVANGEYIHFCDSDDYLSLNFYESMVDAATYAHSDMAVASYNRLDSSYERNLTFPGRTILVNLHEKFSVLSLPMHSQVWRFMFRRELLMRLNAQFIPGFTMREDVMFLLDIVKVADKIATVPDAIYFYTTRPGSELNRKQSPERREFVRVGNAYARKFIQENSIQVPCCEEWKYCLFGKITIIKKRVYRRVRPTIKYYLFGIPVIKIFRDNMK